MNPHRPQSAGRPRRATLAAAAARTVSVVAACALAALVPATLPLRAQLPLPKPLPPALVHANQELAAHHLDAARALFADFLKSHPDNVDALFGLGEADLDLHHYETAEIELRRVVFLKPELWIAHKNLVIVEAALGRWGEFDRERALLRGARERGAPGISARESDIIDNLEVHGQHWIVRQYFEPVGRSQTRYNFERFSPQGRVLEYISLEPAAAAQAALATGGAVRIGGDGTPAAPPVSTFALDWYSGHGHGTIKTYGKDEPRYETVRANVLHWLRTHAAAR